MLVLGDLLLHQNQFSVLTGAAVSEYDRCALQTPGYSATQLVSLVALQHGLQSA